MKRVTKSQLTSTCTCTLFLLHFVSWWIWCSLWIIYAILNSDKVSRQANIYPCKFTPRYSWFLDFDVSHSTKFVVLVIQELQNLSSSKRQNWVPESNWAKFRKLYLLPSTFPSLFFWWIWWKCTNLACFPAIAMARRSDVNIIMHIT